ncbi:MAG: ABC transporter ATP-binding protein [Pseudomonadota bacterium]
MQEQPIIDIRDLSIGFTAAVGVTKEVLCNVDLQVARGETLGLVGESGSGKSTLALAAMGFLKPGLRKLQGDVSFAGRDVFAMSSRELETIRGGKLGLIPQNSGQALTPTMRVGKQLCEALELHCNLHASDCVTKAEDLLDQVQLPDVKAIMKRFPHELSGGQQQRVAIAMALAGEPEALVLDEPTTGLDVTTQIHILDLLRDLSEARNMAMVLVSHDLGVIARCCCRVAVMYAGEVVLDDTAKHVLCAPKIDYAKELLAATPKIQPVDESADRSASSGTDEILTSDDLALCYSNNSILERLFGRERPPLTVEGVSFALKKGETLGLVGESGSGKSTILRAIAGILSPRNGGIDLAGVPLPPLLDKRSGQELRRIQMIFQNPDEALNPRQSVAQILGQPLHLYFGLKGADARQRSVEMLDRVRLPAEYLDRLPGQLSGGEKQRLAVARAFIAEPEIVLCDEVTSALDVSVQAIVMELLQDLKRERQTTYIFVSHDLAVVQQLADQIIVLKQGRICEAGSVDQVYGSPSHPYTKKLFEAVLEPEPM